MSVGPDDASTLKDILKVAGVAISALVGAVWVMLTQKISGLSKKADDDMVAKGELERRARERDVQPEVERQERIKWCY